MTPGKQRRGFLRRSVAAEHELGTSVLSSEQPDQNSHLARVAGAGRAQTNIRRFYKELLLPLKADLQLTSGECQVRSFAGRIHSRQTQQ